MERFGPEMSQRILPIGVSPWVMLFRNGKEWLPQAQEGSSVLLDNDLTGRVVLPESPRVVISIAERLDEPDALMRLRSQALTFDDRNALSVTMIIICSLTKIILFPITRRYIR